MLTGSQKSIYVEYTDARRNLFDAFVAAQDDTLAGVYIVFDGRVILGTRARKTRTKSMNAFSSIDYPDVALLRDGRILHYIREPKPEKPPVFYDRLNPSIFVLRLIPGMNPEVLRPLAKHFDALVIESFGVGGLPCYEQKDFLSAASAWSSAGKPIVITTQVPHEGSDLAVYQVGARAGGSTRHFAGIHDDCRGGRNQADVDSSADVPPCANQEALLHADCARSARL